MRLLKLRHDHNARHRLLDHVDDCCFGLQIIWLGRRCRSSRSRPLCNRPLLTLCYLPFGLRLDQGLPGLPLCGFPSLLCPSSSLKLACCSALGSFGQDTLAPDDSPEDATALSIGKAVDIASWTSQVGAAAEPPTWPGPFALHYGCLSPRAMAC